MQCKHCSNDTDFIEYEHKQYSVRYADGKMVSKDKAPFQWKIQIFCKKCQSLTAESQ